MSPQYNARHQVTPDPRPAEHVMHKILLRFGPCIMFCLAAMLLPAAAQTRPANALDIQALDRPHLLKAAGKFLNQAPQTPTAFPAPRSTGGLHDFFSEGDYWWP